MFQLISHHRSPLLGNGLLVTKVSMATMTSKGVSPNIYFSEILYCLDAIQKLDILSSQKNVRINQISCIDVCKMYKIYYSEIGYYLKSKYLEILKEIKIVVLMYAKCLYKKIL